MNARADSLSRAQVRQIFSMARDTWVREFLLEADPFKDARILTNPLQRFHSISGEHEFTVSKHAAAAGEPRKRSRWLLMPAYNYGSRAAGLFIQHRGDTMHFVRFVRDDDTGEVLYITDIPETGCTEVMHNVQTSSTVRSSAYLRFGTAQFRHAFDASLSDAAVNVLTEALLTSCNISESRACPQCASPPFTRCMCHLPFRRAKHPLDFRFYGTNTSNMFGSYRGRMMLSTYSSGQERSCQVYGVENATNLAPPGVTEQLLQWAVQSRLKLLRVNTAVFAVPDKDVRVSSVRAITDEDTSTDTRDGPISEVLTNDALMICQIVDQLVDNDSSGGNSPLYGDMADDVGSPGADDMPDILDFDIADDIAEMTAMDARANADQIVPLQAGGRGNGAALLLPRRGHEEGGSDLGVDPVMQRKIKKREAAQRSNYRRHIKHRELKAALAEAKAQVRRLEQRKAELEAERDRLREEVKARAAPGLS